MVKVKDRRRVLDRKEGSKLNVEKMDRDNGEEEIKPVIVEMGMRDTVGCTLAERAGDG